MRISIIITPILESPHFLTFPSQRLKHSRWQLVLDQPSKDHEILRLLQQLICKHLAHPVLELSRQKTLTVSRAAADAPEEHVANIA